MPLPKTHLKLCPSCGHLAEKLLTSISCENVRCCNYSEETFREAMRFYSEAFKEEAKDFYAGSVDTDMLWELVSGRNNI